MPCQKWHGHCNITTLDPTQSGLFTDHAPIVFHLKTSIKATTKLTRTVLDYRRGDLDGLRTALDAIDLTSSVKSNNDINIGNIGRILF